MKIIGMTGGVGSGKSLALAYMGSQTGVVIYQADQIARDLQEKGSPCLEEIVKCFGEEVLDSNQELNRKALGNIVFQNEEKLTLLNGIVHPAVRKKVEELIEMHKKLETQIFVLEAAILLESNYQEICDEIWYIYCPETMRFKNLMQSRGYSKDTFEHIASNQMSELEFRQRADCVIENTGSEEDLYRMLKIECNRILGD